MPREKMTDFGVPVDAGIVNYINKIDNLPCINTTFCCSGMRKDHEDKKPRAYLVLATNIYVGEDLPPQNRYPHETHSLSLKVYRAAVLSGWYADFTTTSHKGISGIGGVYLSTQPSKSRYMGLMAGNVTGSPVKTRAMSSEAEDKMSRELKNHFDDGLSDSEVEQKWEELYEELKFELVDRRDKPPR